MILHALLDLLDLTRSWENGVQAKHIGQSAMAKEDFRFKETATY